MAESSVGKELDDQFLQCPICMDRFSKPKTLPKCGHVICEPCLTSIVSRNYGRLKCPICRVDNSSFIRGSGVAGLPDSYQTIALIEYVDLKKKQQEALYSGDPCGVCGKSAVAYCTVCDQLQCQKCQRRHTKITVTKTHKIVSIEEYRSSPAELLRPTSCTIHKGNQVQMYCETCQVPVCLTCIEADHQGENHKHVSLKTAAERKRARLLDLVERVNQKLPDLQTAREMMSKAKDGCIEERTKLYTQVASKTSAVLQAAKEYEQSLLQKIQDHYAPQIDTLESKITKFDELIKQGEHIATAANEMLWNDIDALIFFMEQQHLSQLQKIAKQKTTVPTSRQPPIEFCCRSRKILDLEDAIGTLSVKTVECKSAVSSGLSSIDLQQDSARYTKPIRLVTSASASLNTISCQPKRFKRIAVIDTYGPFHERKSIVQPRGLSLSNDESQFFVAALGNDRVLKYTTGGSYKSQMHFKTPFDVAAIKTLSSIEGNILVTDGKMIIRCNEVGEIYFTEDNGQTSETLGVTTDADQSKVFLLMSINRETKVGVSPLYHLDLVPPTSANKQQTSVVYWDLGSIKTRDEVSFVGDVRFLAVNSHNQIITAEINSCRVMVFDTDTKKLAFSFGSKGMADGQFEKPQGVATDPNDNIYVCSKGKLQLFSAGGRFICRVDSPSDRLSHPVAVCVTKKRPIKVIVTDEDEDGCGKIVIYKEI